MDNESEKTVSRIFQPKHLNLIALVFAAIALVIAIVMWQQYSALRDNTTHTTQQFSQDFLQLKNTFAQYQQQTQTVISDNQKNITILMNQVNEASAQTNSAEVAYLIGLANVHLHLENNIALGIQLLKMAAQNLSSNTAMAIQPLKQALDHDIAVLMAIPQVNLSNLITQLDEMSLQIANLTPSPQMTTPALTTTPSATTQKTVWEKIKYNLSGLKNLFIIRRIDTDGTTTPLLNPQESLFLKENIRLKLALAEWALLREDVTLYQQSLHRAAEWVATFPQNAVDIEKLRKKIEALELMDIKPEIPPLESLRLLKSKPTPTATSVAS